MLDFIYPEGNGEPLKSLEHPSDMFRKFSFSFGWNNFN